MPDSNNILTPRRGTRQRTLSLKAQEATFLSAGSDLSKEQELNICDELDSGSDNELKSKPLILYENEQVSGNKIFTFQARKKCEAVIKPVALKLPYAFKDRSMRDLAESMLGDSSDEDFSYSASESDNSDDNETSQSGILSDGSTSGREATAFKTESVEKCMTKQSLPHKRVKKSYILKTDDYFLHHASRKHLTSSITLDKLETPRLPQDELQRLLSRVKLDSEHGAALKRLIVSNQNYFDKWMYLIHENINILLYGLGSKSEILNAFHEQRLKKLPTIVVHGFFPSLSIRDVLDNIIINLLELKENPVNIYEACELIAKEFSYVPETHFYVIVHNIDMVRSAKAQTVFARLATVNNIHLIASVDHINAPLVWNHSWLSKFNFSWWNTATFQPYIQETSFESSMMVKKTGTLALSSLRNVFLSLTNNSKGIYLILARYQIENSKKQFYQGLAFKDLYSSCRESFLVSSDLALRAQLTEFIDHKMVKYKRSPDGTEYLVIPIADTVLQHFLAEQLCP